MTPTLLFAQNNNGQTNQSDSAQIIEVKISADKLTALENTNSELNKRLHDANKKIFELTKKMIDDSICIKGNNARISKLKADSLYSHESMIKLKAQLLESEKALISMASNFLYIPYEAYSIDSIAISSFESVSDKSLKDKYRIRYSLLKSYKRDIADFVNFLEIQQKELNKPFTKNALDAIATLHEERFYKAYHQYNDWAETYLGKKIVNVELILKSFNGSEIINFDGIINNLQDCIKIE